MARANSPLAMIRQHLLGAALLIAILGVGFGYSAYLLIDTQDRWGLAQTQRDLRQTALSRLRHHLGYGGLVHNYLNAILRGEPETATSALLNVGAVHGALLEYKTLNTSPLERAALDAIRSELDRMYLAIQSLQDGEFAGKTPEEIYLTAGVNLTRLARAVDLLASSSRTASSGPTHLSLLSKYEAAVGLNGMIHHLKVYLLTGGETNLQQAEKASSRSLELLDILSSRATTDAEIEAIEVIRTTMTAYAQAIITARDMRADSAAAMQIDKVIRLDDTEALSGYATLSSFETARQDIQTARISSDLTTARMLLIVLSTVFVATLLRMIWRHQEKIGQDKARLDTVAGELKHLHLRLRKTDNNLDDATRRAALAQACLQRVKGTNFMMTKVLDTLSNGVMAARGLDELLFWNAQFTELMEIPPKWFDTERTFSDLILYLATRGDYGSGDPMEIAGRVEAELSENLKEGTYGTDQTIAGKRVVAIELARHEGGMIVMSVNDITERHNHAADMERQAISDPLTGLPNRTALTDFTASMLKHTQRAGEKAAVLALDLDDFKPINDEMGHGAGDEVLVEIARRLMEEIRETDFVACTGGDEFILVLLHLEDGRGALRFANRLLRAIEMPVQLASGETVKVSASIGVSIFPDDADDLERLYHQADDALYAAKAAGRNSAKSYADILGGASRGALALAGPVRP